MIRTNRVKIMTRAAIFEKQEERKALYISRFFKNDYISLGILKSAISITFVFFLGLCAWAIYHADDLEEIISAVTIDGLIDMGKQIVGWYAVALVCFLAISLAVYSVRYRNAQKRLKSYRGYLRKLLKSYQEDETAKERAI